MAKKTSAAPLRRARLFYVISRLLDQGDPTMAGLFEQHNPRLSAGSDSYSSSRDSVVLLKPHGSIDWFDQAENWRIIDRVVHNDHRIKMRGDSMRQVPPRSATAS